jgi:dipeptidyl aminopeptidase/acylaminoacyl peptidase
LLPDWFHWKTSSRLIASVRFTTKFDGTQPIEETRMVFLDADGGNGVPVRVNKELPGPGTTVYGNIGNKIPQFQDQIVDLLPDDPDHLLMAVTPESDYLHPQVLSVDVNSGRPRLVQRERPDVVSFMTDDAGVVRLAQKVGRVAWNEKQRHFSYEVRDSAESDWRMIFEREADSRPRFAPLGFVPGQPNQLYVLTDGDQGRLVARSFDVTQRSFGAVLAEDSRCDVETLYIDYRLIGFNIPCRSDGLHYLDQAREHDRAAISRALKTDLVRVLDRTKDGTRSLIVSHPQPSAPASFWLLDRSSGKPELSPLGEAYPGVPADQIAEVKLVSYPARDGVAIPALLTLPLGAGQGPIGFVVLPHGGPTAHDRVQFDWMAQFLISRGYGVLQPQFRGSSGYGVEFQQAGYQQWGLLMQDDITDGTRWLISQKLADPKRICIVGASFGGYAALMGVVKEPDLYACAAAFAPVTDLESLVQRLKIFAFKDINIPHIQGTDQSFDATSPADNADKIRVPVLLMHGRQDFTVPVDHTEEMERALKRNHKPVEAIYLDKADHYFATGSDRLAWLGALERFLARPLSAKAD